eukprot:m.185735 g.185735  ORF g.185735 m.185735 type:complete len:276 (+) comp32240_c1_seq1:503-1330(+)
MEQLTEAENTGLGAGAAIIQGIILQPTLYFKNVRQQGLPMSFSPMIVYRGLGASMANEVGSMALQFAVTGAFKHLILGDVIRSLTISEEMGAATLGGCVGALYTSPVELVMIQQQRNGGSMVQTVKRVFTEGGVLRNGMMRGLLPAMARDAIYVAGMLGVTPIVQRYLLRETSWGITGTNFAASIVGGALVGGLSAPFDTIKTCMQGDMSQKKYGSFTDAASKLYAEQGYKRFFNGVFWRITNITGTIVVVNECMHRLAPLVFPERFREHTSEPY